MSDIVYADMCYCSICDLYFPGEEARAEHVQLSANHPKCEDCDRRFANKNSLRNHWVLSPRHHYCSGCRQFFATAGGLRVHVELSAVHRDDSDDEDEEDDDIDDSFEGWEDAVAAVRYPNEGQDEGPPASDDEEYGPADEYWDEDDEVDFEEEQETYWGVAPVSAVGGTTMPVTATPLENADEASTSSQEPRSGTPESYTSSSSTACTSRSSCSEHHTTSAASSSVTKIEHIHRPSSAPVPGELPAHKYGCPLCLEAPQDTSATRCGHIFCTPCIRTALDKKKSCPVCRKPAYRKQLRQIFLPVLS